MPEGDTLFRTAEVLRAVLVGRRVAAARGRPGGARLQLLEGRTIERVEARGKHLLIVAQGGLTLHTHLGMHGSWHRYREGEAWRRPAGQAVAVVEVPGAVAVCFSAPTVELVESRALAIHPVLSRLGPDLLATAPAGAAPGTDSVPGTAAGDEGASGELAGGREAGDEEANDEEAVRRLRAPARAALSIGDALLDQRVLAGIGNVYRSEVCFVERVDPFAPVVDLDDRTLARLVATGRRLLQANAHGRPRTTVGVADAGAPGPGGRLWVYGRAGRPCRRCGHPIRTAVAGPHARRVYWCAVCQPAITPGRRRP